jgi:hypothetical protein
MRIAWVEKESKFFLLWISLIIDPFDLTLQRGGGVGGGGRSI